MRSGAVALILSLSKDEGGPRTVGTWAYMLRCADGRFYVGSFRGDDLNWRVTQHNEGAYPTAWTYKRRPVELVWAEHFDLFIDAFSAERRLKGWTPRQEGGPDPGRL